MKIETTEMPGDVDDFADEVEAGDFSRFHGFAGKFARVDAAGGNFRFSVAFGACGQDWPSVERFFELGERGVGPRGRRVLIEPTVGEALRQETERVAYGSCGARTGGAK